MAHYAFLDKNNIVQEVLVGIDENDLTELPEGFNSWEEYYSNIKGMTCKRTSYNTLMGTHTKDGTPFRFTYAEIGGKYDEVNDIFLPLQPYPSWTLNNNYIWQPPIPKPEENDLENYVWNEDTKSWDLYIFNTNLEIWELSE